MHNPLLRLKDVIEKIWHGNERKEYHETSTKIKENIKNLVNRSNHAVVRVLVLQPQKAVKEFPECTGYSRHTVCGWCVYNTAPPNTLTKFI